MLRGRYSRRPKRRKRAQHKRVAADEKSRSKRYKACSDVVPGTGLTPPLCSGYGFGLANRAAQACPLGASPTNLRFTSDPDIQKNPAPKGAGFFWCRGPDSNRHGIATRGF